jgi:hypothetical protein
MEIKLIFYKQFMGPAKIPHGHVNAVALKPLKGQ